MHEAGARHIPLIVGGTDGVVTAAAHPTMYATAAVNQNVPPDSKEACQGDELGSTANVSVRGDTVSNAQSEQAWLGYETSLLR